MLTDKVEVLDSFGGLLCSEGYIFRGREITEEERREASDSRMKDGCGVYFSIFDKKRSKSVE